MTAALPLYNLGASFGTEFVEALGELPVATPEPLEEEPPPDELTAPPVAPLAIALAKKVE